MEAIPAEKINCGFVYIGPVGDGGWTYMHDQGRLEMESAFPGLKSSYVESVPEGPDSARVMETFVRNGSKVIFATSFGYMDFVQDVAKRYPDVVFMHCSAIKEQTTWASSEECTRHDIFPVSLPKMTKITSSAL